MFWSLLITALSVTDLYVLYSIEEWVESDIEREPCSL